jgi:myo-inositol 2-dehydrogenase/D-chiro-inositol 1-dehydrogenase
MNPSNPTPDQPGTSRREFLKTSATFTAATAALGHLDIARSAYAAGNDTIRIGMIGCGGRNGGAVLQALTADPGVKLVAMCDIFLDRIKAQRAICREKKPDQTAVDDDHCFASFDGYKKVIDSADVVLIANAAKFHPHHTMASPLGRV